MSKFREYLPLLPVGGAFLLILFGLRTASNVVAVEKLRPIAEPAARRAGISVNLLLAVVIKESGGNPSARSSAGALGLTQLKLSAGADAARKLGEPAPTESDLLNPERNLILGAAYLSILLNRYHDAEDVALAAYLKGPEWVARQGGVEGTRVALRQRGEISTYVSRVLDLAEKLKIREH